MNIQQNMVGADGVAGLKKYNVGVVGIVFMLYCLVGAGAFGIEEMISKSGPGMTLLLLCAFPILWAYPISNMVAECGARLPSEGGVYVWAREAYGEFWGFQSGWWATVSTYITNGGYVVLVSGYVSQFINMSPAGSMVLKIGMIAIFTVVNLIGIKPVEQISTVLSIIVIAAFTLVAIVGFINWQTSPVEPFMPEGLNFVESMGEGISICIWMYCGYECISNMAGEVERPQVIPKGLLIAMPLIALTYILPTIAGLASMPAGSWENWSTEGGFGGESIGWASILTTHLGPAWGYIFLVVAIVAQCSIFNTYLASGSRGFFVLADDNLCPDFLVKVSKKRGVPYIGVLSLAVVTLILSLNFDFTTLVSAEVVFMLAMYILLSICTIRLRKIYPLEQRKKEGLFFMPGGKAGLVFFCGSPIVIALIALLVNGTDYLFIGLIAISTGPVAYIILKLRKGGMFREDPKLHPLNNRTRLAYRDLYRLALYSVCTGAIAFFGQFWLRWFEVTNGEWGPDDYDTFGDHISAIMDILKWGGLALMVLALVVYLLARKVEVPENKRDYFIEGETKFEGVEHPADE